MPPALLLLREISTTTTSLASLVEKSQKCEPLICYNLELTTPTKLDLIPQQQQQQQQQQQHDQKINDEGFESDIDTVSVISSDGSLVSATTTITTTQETTQQPTTTTKNGETDSANGSASSDSDNDHLLTNDTNVHRYYAPTTTTTTTTTTTNYYRESYNLVDCVCYSDIRVPDVLLFVIKHEVFVFKFENLIQLRDFYLNFTALKALTNQKTYNSNIYNSTSNNNHDNVGTINNNSKNGGKFNLLQRTDNNGVTHIEITREPEPTTRPPTLQPTNTNIISFNTPEIDYQQQLKQQSSDNLSKLAEKSRTNNNNNNNNSLRKVWNSADDLLGDSPQRPERRRRVKGRAPPPPIHQQQQHQQQQTTPISDVLRGEYVRVNVNVDTIKQPNFIVKSQLKEKPKLTNFVTLLTKPKPSTTTRTTEQQLWTNSVPRLIKIKHNNNNNNNNNKGGGQNSKLPPLRCRSEMRYLPPMAYRYIDQSATNTTTTSPTTTNSISNRLFGLSSKLKDFHLESKMHSKWCSVGDVSIKNDTNLKSVIKKDDNRKKNDKKVTFSAYTTVQVV